LSSNGEPSDIGTRAGKAAESCDCCHRLRWIQLCSCAGIGCRARTGSSQQRPWRRGVGSWAVASANHTPLASIRGAPGGRRAGDALSQRRHCVGSDRDRSDPARSAHTAAPGGTVAASLVEQLFRKQQAFPCALDSVGRYRAATVIAGDSAVAGLGEPAGVGGGGGSDRQTTAPTAALTRAPRGARRVGG
jgi:hypothetical protein